MSEYEQIKTKRSGYFAYVNRNAGNLAMMRNVPKRPAFIFDDADYLLNRINLFDDEMTQRFMQIFGRELDKANAFNQWKEATEQDKNAYRLALADAKTRLNEGELATPIPEQEKFTKQVKVFREGWNAESVARECIDKLRAELEQLKPDLFYSKEQAEFEQWKQENKALYDLAQTLNQILDLHKLKTETRALLHIGKGYKPDFDEWHSYRDFIGNDDEYIASLANHSLEQAKQAYRPGLPHAVMECLERAVETAMKAYTERESQRRIDSAHAQGRELLKRKLAEIESLEKAEKKAR